MKTLLVIALAVAVLLEGYNTRAAVEQSDSAEVLLRQKIVEIENLQGHIIELQSELDEVKASAALVELQNLRKDIKAKKTKNQKSILWFDVNVLTPLEQLAKIDEVIAKAKKQ